MSHGRHRNNLHAFTFELVDTQSAQGEIVTSPIYLMERVKDARALARAEAPFGYIVGAGTHQRDRCPARHNGR